MMYPRLRLARNLLKPEGMILVSCDENEHPRLRLILDELYGEENFVCDFVWAAGRKNDSRLISVSHEYILCYARDATFLRENGIKWRQRKKGLDDIYRKYNSLIKNHNSNFSAMTIELKEWYKNLPDGHPAKANKHYCHVDHRGIYFPADISWPGGGGPKYEVLHPNTKKPVKVPARGWMTSDPNKMQTWIEDERVHFGEDETKVPCIKAYLSENEYQAPYSVFYQDGRAATKRLRSLMECDCFDFPKDENVMQELIGILTDTDDIIFDCFAGSGTTAHGVMLQNINDGGNRRYILIQLPEPLPEKNPGREKFGAETIADLARERLQRSEKKIFKSGQKFGFKFFKLDYSNIKPWDVDFGNLEDALFSSIENIKSDRSESDVLYELLLKYGLDLTIHIEERQIAGKKVYLVGEGALIVCLAEKINLDVVEGIATLKDELKPEVIRVVFKDAGFKDDVIKTNAIQILLKAGIDDVKSL